MSSADNFIIFFSTITVIVLLGAFRLVREWWSAFLKKPFYTLLIVLAISTPFLGNPQGGNIESYMPDAVRLVRIAIIGLLFLICSFILLTKTTSIRNAGSPAKWMIIYGLAAILTTAYSIDPMLTAWKGLEVLTLVLVGIILSNQIKTIDDITWLLGILSVIILFMVVSILVGFVLYPSIASAQFDVATGSMAFAISGIFPLINANSVSQFGAFLATISLTMLLSRGKKSYSPGAWIILSLAIVTAVLGHSRTSIISGTLAVLTILVFGKYYLLASISFFIGLIAFIFTSASVLVSEYIYRGQSQEVFESLSGRTFFWEKVWDTFSQAPMLGHGFYAGQRVMFGVSSVDNTYLEVALGMGIVGLVIFIIPIFKTALTLYKTRPKQNDASTESTIWLQLLSLFIILVIRSMSGPSFQVMHHNLVIYMIMIVSVSSFARLRTVRR